jgi:ribonuclease HI
MNNYTVYADGSCIGNKKIDNCAGSYAFIVVQNEKIIKENVIKATNTTNNRMELMAVISALEYLLPEKDTKIIIKTDSRYVVENWDYVQDWKKNNWRRTNNKPVLNADLWKRLEELHPRFTNLCFQWIKGHGDNKYNQYVDRLARQV